MIDLPVSYPIYSFAPGIYIIIGRRIRLIIPRSLKPVSYTHLDVYKRQVGCVSTGSSGSGHHPEMGE